MFLGSVAAALAIGSKDFGVRIMYAPNDFPSAREIAPIFTVWIQTVNHVNPRDFVNGLPNMLW